MKKGYVVLIVTILILSVCVFAACGDISVTGMSAYDIAVKNGFTGTEKEWLASLKGSDSGKSAYEIAVDNGFDGSETEWLASLKGADGNDGKNGTNGKDGQDVSIEDVYNEWLNQGNEGTYNDFLKEYLGGYVINNTTSSYINRALLSSVIIFCSFTRTEQVYVSGGFFGGGHYEEQESTASAAGAGIIYKLDKETGDAYVITNYHVVFDAKCNTPNHVSNNINLYIYGMQRDQYKVPATYVGGSLNFDIAVLKVEGSEILKNSDAQGVTVFNSNDLVVGQTTIAIGNPEAKGMSVTQGILSVDSEYMEMTGADDETPVTFRTLRIDAPVNEGNSGGGLFNDKGELIGIVNAKIMTSTVESIGYAIPSNIATYVADNIIDNCDGVDNTKVKKCMIGITVENTESKAVFDKEAQVVRVVETITIKEINDDSLVYGKAQKGDILKTLKVGDKVFDITRQFIVIDAMLTVRPGDKIVLTVERNGETIDLEATASEATINVIE